MIYATHFIHKIATQSQNFGGDICLTGEETRCPKLLGKALREQGILGKGERVREYRMCHEGSLVVFPPSKSVWHAIRLSPKGEWVAGDLR